jgi:adenine-specific DNA methylase
MSGVDRDKLRIKQTAEVFTPTELVLIMIDDLEKSNPELFSNPEKTFLDNSCGDGQFLSEIVIRKMERSGCSLVKALSTTYGVELMEDNVIECRKRLAGPNPTDEILQILNKNIVNHNALTYDYKFGGK